MVKAMSEAVQDRGIKRRTRHRNAVESMGRRVGRLALKQPTFNWAVQDKYL